MAFVYALPSMDGYIERVGSAGQRAACVQFVAEALERLRSAGTCAVLATESKVDIHAT